MADKIISNPTEKVVLEACKKEVFWLRAIDASEDGIGVIKYDSKIQTMMNMDLDYYNKHFIGKK